MCICLCLQETLNKRITVVNNVEFKKNLININNIREELLEINNSINELNEILLSHEEVCFMYLDYL